FSYGSTTQVSANSLCLNSDSCISSWPSAGGGAWPFTPSTNYGMNVSATSTPIFDTAGIFASSTSHFVGITANTLSLNFAGTDALLVSTAADGGQLEAYAGNSCSGGLNLMFGLESTGGIDCKQASLTGDVSGILPVANGG